MIHDRPRTPFAAIRVVYEDLPDLIEIETRVAIEDWSGVATAYMSPDALRCRARALMAWCNEASREITIEAGADTGIGWTVLRFYPVDKSGHTVCHIRLATRRAATNARPEETWRLSVEMPTDPGQIERFARRLLSLSETLDEEAVLQGAIR